MRIAFQDTPALHLHPNDDVAIALVPLHIGQTISVGEHTVNLYNEVGPGHKLALRPVPQGAPVHRYGQVIGFATMPIAAGQHVHSHNLAVGDMHLDHQIGSAVRDVLLVPAEQRRTFQGYRRASGRAGTRNAVVVLSTVNCAAHVVRTVAARARAELLPQFPMSPTWSGWHTKTAVASAMVARSLACCSAHWPGLPTTPTWPGLCSLALAARSTSSSR